MKKKSHLTINIVTLATRNKRSSSADKRKQSSFIDTADGSLKVKLSGAYLSGSILKYVLGGKR